jgi:hypothetical protein
MPVDPFGQYQSPDEGIWYGDGYDSGPSWMDLIGQGIDRAAQAYAIGEAGYPAYPLPYPQQQQQPMTVPQLYTSTPTTPVVAPTQGAGIQLSTTTLMLIVGGVLLFMLGTKKGR